MMKLTFLVYITYNDGLIIISDDGFDNYLNIFKVKNLLIMYNVSKKDNLFGKINYRILKVLKSLTLI